ncbi:hypothetical protein IFM89_004174 [Coptis chinensis]|uniref:Uncharacterized protein n=1 Tax=Coptis chinensis TaxID=261450 RepID=A0A835LLA5_9MAGN|nr:hypothetical protein IFM89_004174 [Coptis chinensis]
MVVIRNINYITSKKNNSGSESESASGRETDDEFQDEMKLRNSKTSKIGAKDTSSTGQWLEIDLAETTLDPSDVSSMIAPGTVISIEAKKLNESGELWHESNAGTLKLLKLEQKIQALPIYIALLGKDDGVYGEEADGESWQAFQKFLLRNDDKDVHNTDQDLLLRLKSRPSSAAEIDSIVENCEQLIGNEDEALVKMIIEMFPAPGKPEGTDEDPTEDVADQEAMEAVLASSTKPGGTDEETVETVGDQDSVQTLSFFYYYYISLCGVKLSPHLQLM